MQHAAAAIGGHYGHDYGYGSGGYGYGYSYGYTATDCNCSGHEGCCGCSGYCYGRS